MGGTCAGRSTTSVILIREGFPTGDNFAGGMIASLARQLKTGEVGKLDLLEAIAWGVSSGAFACYYVGGTYIEREEGEKHKIVEIFKYQYIQQISNT